MVLKRQLEQSILVGFHSVHNEFLAINLSDFDSSIVHIHNDIIFADLAVFLRLDFDESAGEVCSYELHLFIVRNELQEQVLVLSEFGLYLGSPHSNRLSDDISPCHLCNFFKLKVEVFSCSFTRFGLIETIPDLLIYLPELH